MTSPIIDFIEARLEEDEATARATLIDVDGSGDWRADEHPVALTVDLYRVRDVNARPVVEEIRSLDDDDDPDNITEYVNGAAVSQHVARHDPARVLREVEAKRAILAAYQPTGNDPHPGEPCTESIEHDPQGLEWEDAQNWAPCERHVKAMQERRGQPVVSEHVLRYLAATYSDHPDYQQEWATDPS